MDKKEKLYLFSWTMLLVGLFINNSKFIIYPYIKNVSHIIQIIATILVCFKILWDLKDMIKEENGNIFKKINYKILFILIILLISFTITNAKGIVYFVFFLLGAKKEYLKNILVYTFCTYLIMLSGIVFSYKINIIPQAHVYRGDDIRYSLGTVSPNYLMMCFFVLSSIYLLINYKKRIRIYNILGVIILNMLVYCLTDSRAGFFLLLVVIILYVLIRKNKLNKIIEKFKVFIIILPIIFAIISVGIPVLSEYANLDKLDNIFSKRISISSQTINDYGFSLLGKKIEWVGQQSIDEINNEKKEYNYIDSSYLNFAINMGILPFIILIVFLTTLNYTALKENNKSYIVLLIVIEIYGMIDSWLFCIENNILWFIICDNIKLFNSKKIDNNITNYIITK